MSDFPNLVTPFLHCVAICCILWVDGQGNKPVSRDQQQQETTMTYKAATFNGNTVTGTGATTAEAKADAQAKAAAIGSCIRKRIY
jgi:lipopolysaccharide export system protein LptA